MSHLALRPGPPSPNISGLVAGMSSLQLTLSAGVGSAVLPAGTTRIGIYPAASAGGRVALGAAPEAIGTKTGNAVWTDFNLGIPLVDLVWQWFDAQVGEDTILYFAGATAGVFTIVVI